MRKGGSVVLRWLPIVLTVLAAACETMTAGDPGNLVPPTVAEDLTLPAIELNGSRFHAETFGNPANPVIVFLHGGPGGDYRALLRLAQRFNGYSLADDYYLVFWDQRGAGLSKRHGKNELTHDTYMDDLTAVLDFYAPGRKPILIGKSWGAMYATMYINTFPQRIAGAVLIESGPFDGASMERVKKEIANVDLGSEPINDWAWAGQFFAPDDHARMDYERNLGLSGGLQPRFGLSETDPAPIWRQGAVVNKYLNSSIQVNGKFVYDFADNLSAFTTPVLFVTGSMSEVLGASLQQQQMTRYPAASLEIVQGAGHDVNWVKAAEVLTHINAYLAARKAAGGIQ